MTINQHAVVIGSSIAGLAAAAALARHFQQVTVLERDVAPTEPHPRKGVPQGNHPHIVLDSGRSALESLFPGLFSEMNEAGSVTMKMGTQLRWFQHGNWRAYGDVGYTFFCQTRPFLEHHVYRRLDALPNVTIRHECSVEGLSHEGGRVRAVQCRGGDTLQADLVIDASGPGSRSPKWLAEWGYGEVNKRTVNVDIAYSSCLFRPGDTPHDWRGMMVYPMPPHQKRVGYIIPVEGGRWIVTMAGYFGDHPPTDPDGFLAFAESLSRPELAQALAGAQRLTDPVRYRFPHQEWRRFHTMRRLPQGFGIVGDAACRFDPAFGQGMSVAAKSALALDRHLSKGVFDAKHFQRQVAQQAMSPWLLTSSEAHRYPEARGHRPLGTGLLHRYVSRLFRHASADLDIYRAFLSVMHLHKEALALLTPGTALRLLRPLPAFEPQPTAPATAAPESPERSVS